VEGVENLTNPEHRVGDTARWALSSIKQDGESVKDLYVEVTNGHETQGSTKPFSVPKSGTKLFDDRKSDFVFFIESPPNGQALMFRVYRKHKHQKDALVGVAYVTRPVGKQKLPLKREGWLHKEADRGLLLVEVREALKPRNAPGTNSVAASTPGGVRSPGSFATVDKPNPSHSAPTLPDAAMRSNASNGVASQGDRPGGGCGSGTAPACYACVGGLADMLRRFTSRVTARVTSNGDPLANQVAFMAEKAKDPSVTKTATGLLYKVIRRGNGRAHPTSTDQVSCRYNGKFVTGEMFDSSRGGEVRFPVNRVVPGWTEALKKMVEGDKWELYLPPHLAYGQNGCPPIIPPNAVLVFEIELVRIVRR